jgi:putative nucleotidyltransferase with HDIG domain
VSVPGLDIPLPDAPGAPLDWAHLVARFAWLQSLAGVPQDPVFHAEGDVWVHTRMVCEALSDNARWRALPDTERTTVMAAALFHDIAKPATTRCEDDGRVTARGHSRRGELMARGALWRMGVPFAVREAVAAMVRYHQHPFFLLDREDAARDALTLSMAARCDHLALLAESDMRGRVCPDQGRVLDAIDLFREYCDELGCLARPRAFANELSRYEYFHTLGRDPDYAAWDEAGFEVVLMAGLPGAGKSRWIRSHRPDWPVVSLDALRASMGRTMDDDQGAIVQAAEARAREHLRARRSFVWDATNLTRQRRAALVSLFAAYGARVRIVYVEAPEAVLRAANAARPEAERVPARVIDSLVQRWEVPDATEAHTLEIALRAEEGGYRTPDMFQVATP